MKDLISVCICTFRRPMMIAKLLEGVISQAVTPEFDFEIVVVDNDKHRSAEEIVLCIQAESLVKISYDCEPEQSFSLARNRTVRNAAGNLIAFIDDDEYPICDWLCRLYRTMKKCAADGVLGPVLPDFPNTAPTWLKRGRVLERLRFKTGTHLSVRDTRTGNVLLDRSLFPKDGVWFDPAFGLTGGEDVDFFGRHIGAGRVFVWCDEAIAHETIPSDRWRTSFHLKKYTRLGTINGERLRQGGISGITEFAKSLVAIPICLVLLIVKLPFGKHEWIRPVLKLAYFGSAVSAYFGISIIRNRDEVDIIPTENQT